METYMEKYLQWINNIALDEATRNELASISEDLSEINERFHKDLEFGTGGLRGIIGAGTNRMNIYTVRRAARGLADYILATTKDGKKRGVAISYVCRHFSKEFALQTALVLASCGIKSYLFDALRPTPVLSFAVRKLNCIAGVMVTASHNPPNYNGYKVYWQDGGQMAHPQDAQVIEYVNKILDPATVEIADYEQAVQTGLISFIGQEIDDAYHACVQKLLINIDCITKMTDDFVIVYSPFYGCGTAPMKRALSEAGFTNVCLVSEQSAPNPDFPTLKYPNPEDPSAFELALRLGADKNADIILATDPDADRVGAMVKNSQGEYELLNGNSVGILLMEYILTQRKHKNPGVVSTFVSTRLAKIIAEHNGAKYTETFTGFKNIAASIATWEKGTCTQFVFGFEESFGYLAGDFVRDKDGISAGMLLCEVAAYYKSHKKTLFDALSDIYEKYGYHKELTYSITLPGLDGAQKMKNMVAGLRSNPPLSVAGIEIERITDYALHENPSDMLYFTLSDKSWFCIRPSGTEPKIKIYFGATGKANKCASDNLQSLSSAVLSLLGQ